MIIDNRYYRIKSIFGYRLRALPSRPRISLWIVCSSVFLELGWFMCNRFVNDGEPFCRSCMVTSGKDWISFGGRRPKNLLRKKLNISENYWIKKASNVFPRELLKVIKIVMKCLLSGWRYAIFLASHFWSLQLSDIAANANKLMQRI